MESLKNEFENFLQEMVENNLNMLKKQNAEYASCKDNEKNSAKTMDKLIDKLSDEDKKLLSRHEINMFTIAAAEQSFLYKRGWHDCIKFLKMTKIL